MNAVTANMIGFAALDILAKSLIILALGFGIVLLPRKGSAAARCLVWQVSLFSLLLLPALWLILSPFNLVTLTAPRFAPQRIAAPVITQPAIRPNEENHTFQPSPSSLSQPLASVETSKDLPTNNAEPVASVAAPAIVTPPAAFPWRETLVCSLLTVWSLGALTLLLRIAAGLLALARSQKRAVITPENVKQLADSLAQRLRFKTQVSILCGAEDMGAFSPMTYGLRRPIILLPEEANRWTTSRLESVLLHEMAHIARRDWAAQILSQFACALYWFNPLVWLAAKAMRAESELACDDMALSAGIVPSDYAAHLLAVVRLINRKSSLSAMSISMAQTSRVESRVRAILDAGRSRRSLNSRLAVSVVCVSVAILLPLAALRVKASSPQNTISMKKEIAATNNLPETTLPEQPAFTSPAPDGLIQPDYPTGATPSKPITQTPESARKDIQNDWNSKNSQNVSWGKPVNGWQAGISIDDPATPITSSQHVTFRLWLKNVAKKKQTLEWVGDGWSALTDDKNRISITRQLILDGEPIIEKLTLNPGVVTSPIGTQATFLVVPKIGSDMRKESCLIADAGKYTVRAAPFQPTKPGTDDWVRQLVTGPLTIQVEEMSQKKEPGPQPAVKNPSPLEGIQWGPISDGLEAGLRIASKTNRFTQGSTIPLACYIRNTTKKPIAFTYTQSVYMDDLPIVHPAPTFDDQVDKAQQRVPLKVVGVRFTGLEGATNLILQAGETVVLHPYGLTLGKVEGDLLKVNPYFEEPKVRNYHLLQPLRYSVTTVQRAEEIAKRASAQGAILIEPMTVTVISADGKERKQNATRVPASTQEIKPLASGLVPFEIYDKVDKPLKFVPADAGEKESDPKNGQTIIWGKTHNGLQSGICFTEDRFQYKAGEKVKLNLYWRNVTDKPISISYVTHPGSAFRPSVFRRSNERMPMDVGIVLGLAGSKTIPPGQTVLVDHPVMELMKAGVNTERGLLPKYNLPVGRYKVNVSGNEQDSSVPESGSLEFEVLEENAKPVVPLAWVNNTGGLFLSAQSEEFIDWGEEYNGLRCGVKYSRPHRKFALGEVVQTDIIFANTLNETISFRYIRGDIGTKMSADSIVHGNLDSSYSHPKPASLRTADIFYFTLKPGAVTNIIHQKIQLLRKGEQISEGGFGTDRIGPIKMEHEIRIQFWNLTGNVVSGRQHFNLTETAGLEKKTFKATTSFNVIK